MADEKIFSGDPGRECVSESRVPELFIAFSVSSTQAYRLRDILYPHPPQKKLIWENKNWS